MATVRTMGNGDRVVALVKRRESVSNEVSSTSSDDCRTGNTDGVVEFNTLRKSRYRESNSDNELARPRVQARAHHKSMGNIHDAYSREASGIRHGQNSVSNIDLSLHGGPKKFDALQIPIVGYEVMEERARFTIYKLKVEDDARDQSWLVFRRYTDFVRLYTRLRAERPELMLPLPGKRWFRDNFEPAFLEERVRGLQVFVNAVIAKLPNHPAVREFFCLDEPPQVFSYQPEVQAVYGALEDSIATLKMQLKQKDATIMHLQRQISQLEGKTRSCPNCNGTKS
ncbi:unnamed protein product, partial [Iphiclides podalirius]